MFLRLVGCVIFVFTIVFFVICFGRIAQRIIILFSLKRLQIGIIVVANGKFIDELALFEFRNVSLNVAYLRRVSRSMVR